MAGNKRTSTRTQHGALRFDERATVPESTIECSIALPLKEQTRGAKLLLLCKLGNETRTLQAAILIF